jgi:CheY-like chemotaxis protein
MKKVIISHHFNSVIKKEQNILSRDDIRVFSVSSGGELLKTHQLEHADIIIMDIDMPDMSGDKVCSSIRKNGALKNVSIMIASEDNKSDIARCQASGANSFITKPVEREELFRTIMKFLNISNRINLRVILNVGVKVQFKYDFFFANSENISSSGILFNTDKELSKGDKATCSFFIGKTLISTHGEIVRVVRKSHDEYSCGMQFINLSSISKSKIERFIRNFMKGK